MPSRCNLCPQTASCAHNLHAAHSANLDGERAGVEEGREKTTNSCDNCANTEGRCAESRPGLALSHADSAITRPRGSGVESARAVRARQNEEYGESFLNQDSVRD